MSKLRTCIGNYATTPYRIGESGVGIYCIEELCYYLVENAELLDQDDFKQNLVEWIDMQLGLRDLARDLMQVLRGINTFALFVSTILEYAHYVTREELVRIREVLNETGRLNPYERQKKRIDHRASMGDAASALYDYQLLISQVGNKDLLLVGDIYNSMGKSACSLFLFEYAQELFEKSYHLTFTKEALVNYIMAVKLHDDPATIKRKLSGIANVDIEALEFEADSRIADAKAAYIQSDEKKCVDELINSGKTPEYKQQVLTLSENLKNEYRKRGE
ncbi:MAG: hypothetical protein KBS85_00455 [Lachnospiraceae bacterium]|nr:hypothetical protein [Candidatus Merdinaster equi]